jgi:hypothetical protein
MIWNDMNLFNLEVNFSLIQPQKGDVLLITQ